jgi:hypothetical protein
MIAGVMGLLVSFGVITGASVPGAEVRSAFGVLGLFPSIGIAFGGLILVATGQMALAVIDSADHTGEVLAIVKAYTGFQKQHLM